MITTCKVGVVRAPGAGAVIWDVEDPTLRHIWVIERTKGISFAGKWVELGNIILS